MGRRPNDRRATPEMGLVREDGSPAEWTSEGLTPGQWALLKRLRRSSVAWRKGLGSTLVNASLQALDPAVPEEPPS